MDNYKCIEERRDTQSIEVARDESLLAQDNKPKHTRKNKSGDYSNSKKPFTDEKAQPEVKVEETPKNASFNKNTEPMRMIQVEPEDSFGKKNLSSSKQSEDEDKKQT